jgi:hypothetical protein
VDVVAPGTNLWSTLAINYFGLNDLVAGTASGTSFAAPHVAGEAALIYGLVEASGIYLTQKGSLLIGGVDHKLVKALIINSADKIPGLDANGVPQSTWQPGQVVVSGGVPNAVVPLNYAVGAGSANALEAVKQFNEDGDRFWDLGNLVSTGNEVYYTFGTGKFVSADPDKPFLFSLTATLIWDRHVDFDVNMDSGDESLGDVTKDLLSNLDLFLQKGVSPGVWEDVYASAGTLDNVEHIWMPEIFGEDNYRLEVRATDLADTGGESYAIAVAYSTVPEPGAAGWMGVSVLIYVAKRRRRCSRGQ